MFDSPCDDAGRYEKSGDKLSEVQGKVDNVKGLMQDNVWQLAFLMIVRHHLICSKAVF